MARNRNYQIEKKWLIANSGKVFKSEQYSSAFIELLARRGIDSEAAAAEFVTPDYAHLTDPFLIPGMKEAVESIKKATDKQTKIVIYGDYDVDGVTATAILSDFFHCIGLEADTYIPSRIDEGYGLNQEAIKSLADIGTEMIITVDCGSTSLVEIDYANSLGLEVVVTDHHTLKQEKGKIVLPKAIAVVNPHRIESESPLKGLAGAGVAFYLVRALMSVLGDKYAVGQEKWLLDLVALGTICDIVPLTHDNRILTYYGLKVLSRTRRRGLRALAKIAEFNLEVVDSYKVGFVIGPRLNAAGRIEHAKAALELLLTDNNERAEELAYDLDELNKERQELTERIVNEARESIEKDGNKKSIYLLSGEDWPAGVVGIVASRLLEEYGKPMLVMEDMGDELKGSARSVSELNIIDALTDSGDLLTSYGGHAYAAGFRLDKNKFLLLEDKLISIANSKISVADLIPIVDIEQVVKLEQVNKQFVQEVEKLEPFGRDNKKPVFASYGVKLPDLRLVGNPPIHLKMAASQNGNKLAGIAFGYGETLDLEEDKEYDIAYAVEINEWNNMKTPEFRLIDIRKAVK